VTYLLSPMEEVSNGWTQYQIRTLYDAAPIFKRSGREI